MAPWCPNAALPSIPLTQRGGRGERAPGASDGHREIVAAVFNHLVMGKNQHSKDRLFLTATECDAVCLCASVSLQGVTSCVLGVAVAGGGSWAVGSECKSALELPARTAVSGPQPGAPVCFPARTCACAVVCVCLCPLPRAAALPFDSCFLSLTPFTVRPRSCAPRWPVSPSKYPTQLCAVCTPCPAQTPVCSPEGHVFEVGNITSWLKKHRSVRPPRGRTRACAQQLEAEVLRRRRPRRTR